MPSWCTVSEETHVADLGKLEGFVIHWSPEERGVQHAQGAYIDGTADSEDPAQVYLRSSADGMTLEEAEQLAHARHAAVREARP